jgi:hypothetical protein
MSKRTLDSLRAGLIRGMLGCLLFAVFSCNSVSENIGDVLFTRMDPVYTNITFENALTETDSFNYFLFSYIYMGGGVSVGDFNLDGLTDIYFTGNMEPNRLYLNRGGLVFEDVTERSQTGGDQRWMLGSTLCDINDDGLPDIYVSVSGLLGSTENLLFVNQGTNGEGIPIFREEAGKYGIADPGLSTQGTFFDYDNDGDLDLYVANYPITQFNSPPFFYRQMMRNVKMKDSDHLYRNNGDGSFSNVTIESGLLSFGLSLSATVSDLNRDGFKDLYVSNDFTSPDYFYFNNGDGTFTDRTGEVMGQTSFYGMGADIADYNNDGLADIMQIDMAPEDNKRAKENMSAMDPADFKDMILEGLHHQYKYSTLFLNRGNRASGLPWFSNAAWMAGVTSTDWSWAALFADFDLDGWKDLYITNGSRRDINNIDYFNRMQKSEYFDRGLDRTEYLDQIMEMPFKPLANYMFRNNGDLTFTRTDKAWGMYDPGYSNGVAYADLDNDGDLELIVNNIDDKALVYKNNSVEQGRGNYLKISFEGPPGNRMGVGCTVHLWHRGKMQMGELTLSRGYESSVEPILYFGLSVDQVVDSVKATWADGRVQVVKHIKSNQSFTFSHEDSSPPKRLPEPTVTVFEERTAQVDFGFLHRENQYNDLQKQILLPHMLSRQGPFVSNGDVDGDLQEDFFIGNATGENAALFIQDTGGNFTLRKGPWEKDRMAEDAASCLFDADGDGDLDLYVVSGGNEFPEGSEQYRDRLYVNDGQGNFTRNISALPAISSSGSCVEPIDFDRDGDLDLFVGGRHQPGRYPFPPNSAILENRSAPGKIQFEDVTTQVTPGLLEAGMVTDAHCADMDNDTWDDLVVVGEWMPVCIFKNTEGVFKKQTVEGTRGWWFCIEGADFDGDGDQDLAAGNLGLNFRYRSGQDETFDIYAGDFDRDGSSDIVLSYFQEKKQYPLRGREALVKQNPIIGINFPTYESFGDATVSDIYSNRVLKQSLHLQSEIFASCYLENLGDGNFEIHPFSGEAQLSSLNAMLIKDFNRDGNLDILAAGNLYGVEIVTPRNDGGVGVLLEGDGHGGFEGLPARKTGFFANGDVKSLSLLSINRKGWEGMILVGNNNREMQVIKINHPPEGN